MRTLAAVAVLSLSCSSADDAEQMPSCIDLPPDCSPLYTPTFDELFTRTLMPTCGQGGGSCHGPDGQQGGLVFASADEAFALLTGADARVVPGNPACSEIVVRTHQTGKPWSMPPGNPLIEAERCVIGKWVEMGALR